MIRPALLVALAAAGSPLGSPIWEIGGSWICKTKSGRYCTIAATDCRLQSGEAVFQINFNTGIFKTLGEPSEFDEHVIGRKFYDDRFGQGMSKVWLTSGDSIAFAANRSTGLTEPGSGYEFVATRSGYKNQNIYYGICYPA